MYKNLLNKFLRNTIVIFTLLSTSIFLLSISDLFTTSDEIRINLGKDSIQDEIKTSAPPNWISTNAIEINGSATGVGAHNWTWAYAQPWCGYGDGSWGDPYMIQNVKITNTTGGSITPCLKITNSTVFFIVKNCTFIKDNQYGSNSGIHLIAVANGTITNTTCKIAGTGIKLAPNCRNNTISESTFNNLWYGIQIGQNCMFNNISKNSFNGYIGIASSQQNCKNNTISNNNMICSQSGIQLENNNCDNNTISNNTISSLKSISIGYSKNVLIQNNTLSTPSNNGFAGVYLYNSINIKLEHNTFLKCGIVVESQSANFKYYTSHSIDATNIANGKPIYYYANKTNLGASNFTNAGQILLANCNYSNVSNSNIFICTYGISVFYGHNNTIFKNNCSNNKNGIYIYTTAPNEVKR